MMFKFYAVRLGTTSMIVASDSVELLLQNAQNTGFTAEQVEILTQAEFDARKALEPQPIAEPSDKERITELEQIINMILMGDM